MVCSRSLASGDSFKSEGFRAGSPVIDSDGKVLSQNIDPWSGDQELLKCAADVMGRLSFAPPPFGRGTVLARIVFNPRAGSR